MRQGKSRQWAAAIAVTLALTGCANITRIERAKTMVVAGRETADATRDLLATTRAANREALIDLVASDSNCRLPEPKILTTRLPEAKICAPPGSGVASEPFERLTETNFRSTLAVVRSLTAYLDKVDAIVASEPLDIGAEIAAVRSEIDTILGAAQAVAGGEQRKLIGFNDDQQKAIDGALALLSAIADEERKVGELRLLESGKVQAEFRTTLGSLKQANDHWIDRLTGQLSVRQTLLAAQLRSVQSGTEAQRRPAAAALLAVMEQRDGTAVLRKATTSLTDELDRAHAAYLDLLLNKGADRTEEEKRREARIVRARVIGALQSFTAILKAF